MQEPKEEETAYVYELREEEKEGGYVPQFLRSGEEELEGAARGTAYHRVLETIDFSKTGTKEGIEEELGRLTAEKKLTEQMRRAVSAPELFRLFSGKLGQRMRTAWERGQLYREQPFVISVKAEEVQDAFGSGEEILIQGIIDLYFLEGGETVLVDYKTDRVPYGNPEVLVEKYRVQLAYYQEALRRMTGREVKETYLYSLSLGREIPVE